MILKIDYDSGNFVFAKKHDIFPEKVIRKFVLKETGLDVFLLDPVSCYDPSYCIINNKYNGLIKFFAPNKYQLSIKSIVRQKRKNKKFLMLINGRPGKNSEFVAGFGETGNFLIPPLNLIRNQRLKDFIIFNECGSENNFVVVQNYQTGLVNKLYEIEG